jgi:hypothetical protein
MDAHKRNTLAQTKACASIALRTLTVSSQLSFTTSYGTYAQVRSFIYLILGTHFIKSYDNSTCERS